MERWYAATGQRFSVRKYEAAPGEEDLTELKAQAKNISARSVRIAIGFNEKAFASVPLGKGRIKGTGYFAAFLSKNAEAHAAGYLGEAFILECTAMGLGTCWLGMYNKKAVAQTLQLSGDEYLTCITPLGAPGETYAARPRKPLNRLTSLTQKELQALPEWQRHALECARRAPSAINAQPWRYVVEDEAIRIISTGGNYGFGGIDFGITMLHMELGAAHGGVAGEWAVENGEALFTPTSYNN
jgi:nitroreductase